LTSRTIPSGERDPREPSTRQTASTTPPPDRERSLTVRPESEVARASVRPSGIELRGSMATESAKPPGLRPRTPIPPFQGATGIADAWLECQARIQDAPDAGTVRGLYFSEILRLVPALRSCNRRRYVPFSKYPLREYMQLLVDAAQFAHPGKEPERALRELGMTTYGTFAASMAGASLLSSPAFHDGRLLDLAPQAYPLTIEPGSVEIVSRSTHDAVVKLRDLWTFPESFQKGVWLGAMRMLGIDGSIDVIRHGWCSVDFHVRWSGPNQ